MQMVEHVVRGVAYGLACLLECMLVLGCGPIHLNLNPQIGR